MAKSKKPQPAKNDFEGFLQQVGERLKQLRIEKGYTNYEHFAYDHNIARSQYGKYEQGKDDMRLSSLYKLIQNHGLSFKEFFKNID